MKISRGIFLRRPIDDERPWVCSKKSVQQGRLLPGLSRRATLLFFARSVLVLRERSRPEEGQACEPEGPEKWRERRLAYPILNKVGPLFSTDP